ncbi:hypothetical protein BTA51_03945 [Hahella sp. CCB-MM4]|uniref:omptin family outer membrane protease n=1 Tax=Hahella sp. (strain CCB-MM4) TaxID=1926491 RepID=UPI000B9AF627|nr:omptin family outer membrane protease [Hahella sp. CCB-MM4]OZG74179.1 hypothetical protein BTA51_03945 [Hahella sp. CCB-MM4]
MSENLTIDSGCLEKPWRLCWLIVLVVASTHLRAEYEGHLDAYMNLGYGSGQLDWNIADSDGHPNVLSELIFNADDVVILELGGRLFIDSGPLKHVFGEMRGWAGMIEDGTSEDRDWNSDNREDLYSFSRSELYGHKLKKFSLALGYRLPLNDMLTLSPMVGYAYSSQSMQVRNGFQLVSESPSTADLGPFDDLDSSYNAEWWSFWVGGEVVFSFAEQHDILLRVELHAADYEAKANWNLRNDLAHPVSFRHDMDDQKGYLIGIRYRYPIYQSLSITAGIEYEKLEGDDGTDTIFLSDSTTIVSPLNEVNWELTRFNVGANYRF